MGKKILVAVMVALLLVPAIPRESQSGIVVGGLMLFGGWLFGRIMDAIVDRYVLKSELKVAEHEIDVARQHVREKRLDGVSLTAREKRELLLALSDAKQLLVDFDRYVSSHRMTDDQLLDYCEQMLNERIMPLQGRLARQAGRMIVVESRLDSMATRVEYLEDLGLQTTRSVSGIAADVQTQKTRVDVLEENDKKTKQLVGWIEDEVAYIGRTVERMQGDIVVLQDDVEGLKSKHRISWVLGANYQAFEYKPSVWNRRYQYLPVKIESTKMTKGGHISLGLWINRLFHFEGGIHYIPEQVQRVDTKDVDFHYDLHTEGLAWSAVGLVTLPVGEESSFDLGAGFIRSNYEVGYEAIDKQTSQVVGEESQRAHAEDLLTAVGLRLGADDFFVALRLDAIIDDWEIRGYYAHLGLQWIL